MIDIKYKKIYDEFITKYEEIHVDPWHEINKEELDNIYNQLVNSMDINNDYSFKYFMDYIIKRLSGYSDAHTKYQKVDLIPLNFRMFDNEVLINYPDYMKGYKLVSINKIPLDNIIKELEEVITYGTDGKRRYELEKALFNKDIMFSLPPLKSDELVYEIEDLEGNIVQRTFSKNESYDDMFDYDNYRFGNNTQYRFIDNCLVYNHSSVQQGFEKEIINSIEKLKEEDLSNIDTIIIDIRGNTGGDSRLNKLLIDFLEENKDKKLICLTDYRVFSSGRFVLKDLIDLGAVTIGEEISTPINCFGNSYWFEIDGYEFTVSRSYFHPLVEWGASSKEEFERGKNEDLLKPCIFKPSIPVNETKEDYINNIDTIINYALEHSKKMKLDK